MPISAVFTADFTRWNEALRNATQSLKPLEVSAKGVQSQLERMAKSLSGADIIKQANLATAAVKSIGGATALTATEQKKLNATVTEAIAKYAALGQKAPADMLALAKATKQSESAFSGITTALGPIKGLIAGAFAVGTITRLAGEALKFASDLNDLSAKTGISTKALQEFKFAGDQVGVTLDDVSTAVLQMQKHLVGGDKSTVEALKKIGVSFKELQALSPEDQFVKIADALRKIEDPAVRNKTAFDLMGKAAANVLPLIATDLSKTAAEAERLGIVLDQQTIDQLDNLGDTWAKVRLAGEALIAKALVPFVPAILKILEAIGPLSRDMGKLPTDFKKLEIELLQLAVITRQAALSFLELTKWTQPLNVATGQYEKSVKSIQGEMLGLIEKVGKAQQELRDMEAPQKSVTDGAKKAAVAFGDWGDAAKKSADKIGQGSGVIREELSKIAAALEKVEERSDAAFEALNQADELLSLKQQLDQVENRINKVSDAETEWILGTQHLLVNKSTVVHDYFAMLVKQQEAAKKATEDWKQTLDNLSHSFAELAQISGGALGKTLSLIGKIVGATSLAVHAVDGISSAIGSIKAADSIGGMTKGIAQLATGILGAVAAAIQLGSALADAFHRSRPEQLQSSVLHDFGVSIGEDLGKVIADSAIKQFGGSFQAAQIGNLDKIIQAGGGITIQNLDKLEARLHDVFSLMHTGELTAAQGQDVLNNNFQTFVDFLGGRVNPALKEIIKLNDQFGTQSKAIAQYVDAQANTALGALSKVISGRGNLVKELADAQKAVDDAKKHGSSDDRKKAAKNLQNVQEKLAAQPLTKGGAQAEGAALLGIFERLTKDGASAIDVLKQMAPVIESLDKQLAQAGLSGGAAFDQIKSLASIATDEIAGPAFEAIQSFGQALEGLNNAGILNQEEFSGLSEQITATYNAAVEALTKQGKDGSEALGLVAPQLQEIWELQQDFGYAVDDSTQKLLDQAVAAGDVGEKHRSVQEQTLDTMNHLDEVITAIGEKFGVYLPDKAKEGATGINDAFAGVKEPQVIGDMGERMKFGFPEDAKFGADGINLALAKITDPEKLQEMQKTLRDKLPEDAISGVGGINRAFDNIVVPDISVPVKFDLPELPDNITHGSAVPFSSGGLVPFLPKAFANGGMVPSEAMLKRIQPVYAAGGFFTPRGTDTVPAMLSPGEFVVSRRGVQSAGMPALRSINNGVPAVGGGNVTTINVYVDNKLDTHSSQVLAQAIAPHLPGVVANGGSTHGKWARMTKALAK